MDDDIEQLCEWLIEFEEKLLLQAGLSLKDKDDEPQWVAGALVLGVRITKAIRQTFVDRELRPDPPPPKPPAASKRPR